MPKTTEYLKNKAQYDALKDTVRKEVQEENEKQKLYPFHEDVNKVMEAFLDSYQPTDDVVQTKSEFLPHDEVLDVFFSVVSREPDTFELKKEYIFRLMMEKGFELRIINKQAYWLVKEK
jgi:hypothetical protein